MQSSVTDVVYVYLSTLSKGPALSKGCGMAGKLGKHLKRHN